MFKKVKRRIKELQRWKARHRVFSWPSYGKWVEEVHNDKTHFVPFTKQPYQRQDGDVKIFAYYLTQFHAIPENDEAHGKGFTEWTNVASAQPHFVGHYQPKIPYDLGFYNLLMPGVMERQVEIAKAYGIYGFCFYYYWFSGKKVLEKPLEYWLNHKEIDFHYHFCWANENWSKLWDGGDRELILEQKLQDGDAERFFVDILPYFKDVRYEKVDNKPILAIYTPQKFEENKIITFKKEIDQLAREHGFDGIYFLATNAFGFNTPIEYGFEGIIQFPPHGIDSYICEERTISRLIPSTEFVIWSMKDFIDNKCYLQSTSYPLFLTCFTGWDNTPRKAWSRAWCLLLGDEQFATWLTDIIRWTKENHKSNEQYVYINAWNEWGEGAILEPTLRYGYKNLSIVKKCLEDCRNK